MCWRVLQGSPAERKGCSCLSVDCRVASFELEEFEAAKAAFEEAKRLDPKNKQTLRDKARHRKLDVWMTPAPCDTLYRCHCCA